jgi:multidrug efflux pump subunit AcrA (membrane-fusion protein)
VAVHVVAAQRGAIADVLTVSGETAALKTVRLASPVAGRITELAVQPGERLADNAVAARVLPLENEAAVHGLGVMSDAGALGGDERPMAQRLARDLANRAIAVRAPFAGIVADRLHSAGEQVASGEVLLELFDPRSLVVLAQVPVPAAAKVRAQQAVEIRAGEARCAGEVTAVLAAVTAGSLTVPVRIAPTQPLQPPLLHAAVEAQITLAEHSDALLIPRTALLSSSVGDHGTVMVVSGDHGWRRQVQLGLRDAEHVEVIAGLTPGELVVADGGFALPDGALVAPQPAG